MGKYSLTHFDRCVLRIIAANPDGIRSFLVHEKLIEMWQGQSKFRQWGGPLLAAIFGPSLGAMHVSLEKLEDFELVTFWWGEKTYPNAKYRPRVYQIKQSLRTDNTLRGA